MTRVNLGAGEDRREGYVSVDLRADVADVVADVKHLPIRSGCMEEVLAVDILEHFPAHSTAALLAEWRRVLTPEGRLVARVPNMQALARQLYGRPDAARAFIANIYGGHRWGSDGAWDAHHTGWTPALLHDELKAAGFRVVSDDEALNNTVEAVCA